MALSRFFKEDGVAYSRIAKLSLKQSIAKLLSSSKQLVQFRRKSWPQLPVSFTLVERFCVKDRHIGDSGTCHCLPANAWPTLEDGVACSTISRVRVRRQGGLGI